MSDFSLSVLNPRGDDPDQHFHDYAGNPDPTVHGPINYHGYAACVAGRYLRDVDAAVRINAPVLLLLQPNFKTCLKALKRLKAAGLTVAVTLKEAGQPQFHAQTRNPRNLAVLIEILNLADGVLSSNHYMVPIYRALVGERGQPPPRFVPTPYPVDDPRWDHSVEVEGRQGIFVGTRHFGQPGRNHLQALIIVGALARQLDCPIGLIGDNDRNLNEILEILGVDRSRCNVRRQLPYPDYLRFMARFRVVFQLDTLATCGQVAGDCTLTRQICLGGNGSIDTMVFPEFQAAGQDRGALLRSLEEIMTNDGYYRDSLATAEKRAQDLLSFEVVRSELAAYFASIA